MQYRPRRASARWTAEAPEYVLACYDYGAKAGGDRYTVLIGGSLYDPILAPGRRVEYLAMSGAPTHPQGFSQWGEMAAADRASCGKHVRWLDLPDHIRAHVVARATQEG
jgi:hypothetical protein